MSAIKPDELADWHLHCGVSHIMSKKAVSCRCDGLFPKTDNLAPLMPQNQDPAYNCK